MDALEHHLRTGVQSIGREGVEFGATPIVNLTTTPMSYAMAFSHLFRRADADITDQRRRFVDVKVKEWMGYLSRYVWQPNFETSEIEQAELEHLAMGTADLGDEAAGALIPRTPPPGARTGRSSLIPCRTKARARSRISSPASPRSTRALRRTRPPFRCSSSASGSAHRRLGTLRSP